MLILDFDWSKLLEANLKDLSNHSVQSEIGEAQVQRMKKSVKVYQKRLKSSFPFGEIAKLIHSNKLTESISFEEVLQRIELSTEIGVVISEWADSQNALLDIILLENLTKAKELGWRGAMLDFAGQTGLQHSFGADVTVFNAQISPSVISWARERAGLLIDTISETNRKKVGNIIANGLSDQLGVDKIMRNIRDFVDSDEINTIRAEMIARTETNMALSNGAFDAAMGVGARKKNWITVGDDRVDTVVCLPNELQGDIDIDRSFNSGHSHTPGHIRCRCVNTYRGVNKEKVRVQLLKRSSGDFLPESIGQ